MILVNISGGKDSQAALDETVRAAEAAGVRDRIVTVFCDLGDEDEWPGTRELAAEHAAHYGLRHEVVRRQITAPAAQRVQQTLSEHIEQRGMWPDAARRYCTSDLKRAPVHRLMTRLTAEQRAAGITGRRVRILNVLGLRAQESAKRALMTPFSHDERATNQTVRLGRRVAAHPLLDHAAGVGADHRAGTRPHPIYAAGMPRLSCRFCVLASRTALILAARLDPEGAERRAAMEQRMGHAFRQDTADAGHHRRGQDRPRPGDRRGLGGLMLYLANPSTPPVRDAMAAGPLAAHHDPPAGQPAARRRPCSPSTTAAARARTGSPAPATPVTGRT